MLINRNIQEELLMASYANAWWVDGAPGQGNLFCKIVPPSLADVPDANAIQAITWRGTWKPLEQTYETDAQSYSYQELALTADQFDVPMPNGEWIDKGDIYFLFVRYVSITNSGVVLNVYPSKCFAFVFVGNDTGTQYVDTVPGVGDPNVVLSVGPGRVVGCISPVACVPDFPPGEQPKEQ
jgi:hypothetical protein